MHCTVLLVNSVVVCAAVFRVFGTEVTELPLVATIQNGRNQGYFKVLFAFLQSLLSFLEVEKIVLPATARAKGMWKTKFGFQEMNEEEVTLCLKQYPSIVPFEETVMLCKCLPKFARRKEAPNRKSG
ncbi:hypothetical protein Dimus_007082 [Dionaea muscipula]